MDRFTMTPQQRRDATRATMLTLGHLPRHATQLLVDFEGGRWFEHEFFVRNVLADGPGPGDVELNFARLQSMLDRELRRGGWVDDLGPAAFGVLWLSSQLAAGELGQLAMQIDPTTAQLIATTLAMVFTRLGEF